MRSFCLFLFAIVCACATHAQNKASLSVNWSSPGMFTTKRVSLNTKDVKLACNNCKCMELEVCCGITGLFIMGNGTCELPGKNIADKFTACLIRFNPQEYKEFIVSAPKEKLQDAAFYTQSKDILKNMFRHCYHSGMDALIPDKTSYAVNFYGQKYGDVLASYDAQNSIVYSFTNKRELVVSADAAPVQAQLPAKKAKHYKKHRRSRHAS